MHSRIRNGKCSKCGRAESSGVTKVGNLICRSCDPIFWEHCAEIDKNMWIKGDTNVRNKSKK